MFTLNRMVAVIMVIGISSCQKRTLCQTKLKTGGISNIRIYANTYNTPEEYDDAIAAQKAQGYTCDDSTNAVV